MLNINEFFFDEKTKNKDPFNYTGLIIYSLGVILSFQLKKFINFLLFNKIMYIFAL